MSKFTKLLESTMVRFQRSAFLTGDPVNFKKGWEKNSWVQENPDYANKIQEFITSGDTLRISATKAWPTSVQGSYGNYENELANLADITRETAPGLYIDFMTVPTKLLTRVYTGINLTKVPENKRRKDSTQIKPTEIDAKKAKGGEINYTQERQTGIGENDDRHLHNKNVVLPHGKKWNDKKTGAGNIPKTKLHKFRENVSLNKNDESCIFEAYKHMYKEDYKMIPGQTPYTPKEEKQLHSLVSSAAEGDPGEGNEGSRQAIPDGTKVTFNMNDISSSEFGDDSPFDEPSSNDHPGKESDIKNWQEVLEQYEGKIATIDCCACQCAAEGDEPDKDYEYYDITFEDGRTMYAISGYQLTPVKNEPEAQAVEVEGPVSKTNIPPLEGPQ
jgi:hypothetical protein